ncbi:MAG: deoxyribodipyrimidine photo-lyase [Lentimonas sp.]
MFKPSLKAAYSTLEEFLPRAGSDYAANRNTDTQPGERKNVSQLSPWVRTRLLPEWKIVQQVLKQHSASAASKFIDEVCWRTYWKGWLQLRPSIWDNYLSTLDVQINQQNQDKHYTATIKGQSGIKCLDSWTRELIKSGYLHNHARMWYASIWIHTLQLPWTLGAAFFLTHLLDGDPASNTLSWRWVAGLHTVGKTYLARPNNICKYTNGRFAVNEQLAEQPLKLDAPPLPKPRVIPDLEKVPTESKLGLLVQEDDLSAPNWICKKFEIHSIAGLFLKDIYKTHHIAHTVTDFRITCLKDALGTNTDYLESIEAVLNWAKRENLDAVIMAEVPVGLWNNSILELEATLEQQSIGLYFARHWWNEILHPHAKAGFFRFKQAIPKALSKISDADA